MFILVFIYCFQACSCSRLSGAGMSLHVAQAVESQGAEIFQVEGIWQRPKQGPLELQQS